MRKFLVLLFTLIGLSTQALAWDQWDVFKEANVVKGRVIDYSDSRLVTTSEGQSYALFFALVANDQKQFESLLTWTANNLSQGDLSQHLPAWLWGKDGQNWTILDSNNAVDSDMWIAYCLLEAGRLWGRDDYTKKGQALLKLLETQVRDIANLGKVLLPGRIGFEKDDEVKLNPSYYPLFILKRFAQEDPQWNAVFDGSLRVLLRSAPSGIAPDWCNFTKEGDLMELTDADNTIGSYNAIRVYLWLGMMSPRDPAYRQLKMHFAPMVKLTEELNMPPEKVDVNTLKVNRPGPVGFGACLLPMVDNERVSTFIRTVLLSTPLAKDSYYSNVLTLYGLGFKEKVFPFDEKGYLYFPGQKAATQNKKGSV